MTVVFMNSAYFFKWDVLDQKAQAELVTVNTTHHIPHCGLNPANNTNVGMNKERKQM